MRRPTRTALPLLAVSVAVALVVPLLLAANGFRVVAREWFVEHEYSRGGFPADRYGLSREQRTALALIGLRSIQPGTEGVELLRAATLPDGVAAFDGREIAHMADVRRLFVGTMWGQLVAIVVIIVLAVVLGRTRTGRTTVPRGLLGGALLTLLVGLVTVPVVLLGFDEFLLGFHTLLFEGDTWRFAESDTLLRLYPELFWQHTAQLVAGLALAQAVVLGAASWLWLRALRRRAERSPGA